MIPEPLSYMDQAVLARFTRQEDCLALQAPCTCLSLERHTRRGTGSSSSPTLGSCVAICQLVHLHEQCEILMASTRTKGH